MAIEMLVNWIFCLPATSQTYHAASMLQMSSTMRTALQLDATQGLDRSCLPSHTPTYSWAAYTHEMLQHRFSFVQHNLQTGMHALHAAPMVLDYVDWTYIAVSCCLQDHIASDGSFTASTDLRRTDADPSAAHMQASPKQQTLNRPPGLPETAPVAEPISDRDLRTLVDWVSSCRRLVVLTGAGCSTESDIPDYRGPKGAYSSGFQPMTHQQVSSPDDCCCLETQTHASRLHAPVCSCGTTKPCPDRGPLAGQLPGGLLLL